MSPRPLLLRLPTTWLLAMGLLLLVARPADAQTTSQAIVDAFYPESLVAAANASHTLPLLRYSCYGVLESDASGNATTIVAAYTDAFTAVIRLLRRQTTTFAVVAELEGLELVGTECTIEFVGFGGNGHHDVKLSLQQDKTSQDWLFTYDASGLHNVTPVEPSRRGRLKTKLLNIDLVDVTGDAIPELVSQTSSGGDMLGPLAVYRWSNGAFMLEPQLALAVWEFARRTGIPQTTTLSALRPAGLSGPFTLRVINGWRDTQGRLQDTVASGTISVNGVEVAGPDAFGSNVSGFDRTVSLQEENRVAVTLAGTPQGRILLMLLAAP